MAVDTQYEEFYSCQSKVPQFGKEGQEKLSNKKCLIIGMGGLGCPASIYLAVSGVGCIGICDSDVVDVSNINRQILYALQDVGKKKIELAAKKLSEQNPYIIIQTHDTRLHEENWKEIIEQYDIVLDCSDNFYSKFLIHDACQLLKKNLIQAGVFQTFGQIYYFPFGENKKDVPCLRCVWDDIPGVVNQVDCKMAGVLSVVVGSVGLQQASLAIKSMLEKAQHMFFMQMYDWTTLQWMSIEAEKNTTCSCCNEVQLKKDTAYLYGPAIERENFPQDNENIIVLDVRNEKDQLHNKLFGDRKIMSLSDLALSNFEEYITHIDKDKKYLLVCYKGIRSLDLARRMRMQGYKVQSLIGGYTNL